MAALVGNLRPEFDTAAIKVSLPVRSDTWQTLAGLANWINGHGSMIVPWHFPGRTIASGSTETFRYYVKPKAQTRLRIWAVLARASGFDGQMQLAAPTGASAVLSELHGTRETTRPIYFAETVTSSTTAGEINIDVKAVNKSLTVDAIACYEQTRSQLALNATDNGVALESCRARQPIIDLSNRSVAGVCDAYDALDARRSSLLQWSVPTAAAPFTASTSYQALFEDPPFIVAPIIDSTAASCPYSVRAYVKATGGSIFVQATSAAGSVSNSTSGTSFAWLSVGTLTVASEDLTDVDGYPTGGLDTCKIEIKCGTGTKAEIAGVSVLRETLPL